MSAGFGVVSAAAARRLPAFGRDPRAAGPGADRLVALDPPGPGVSVYEPAVAIDPANADRIAVAAQYGIRGGRAGRNLQLWTSDDAGRTWFSRRVPRPKFDGEFTADPLVAFDTGGAILVVGDCGDKRVADLNDSKSFTRWTVPARVQPATKEEHAKSRDILETAVIGVSRSEDGGRTMRAGRTRRSPCPERPWTSAPCRRADHRQLEIRPLARAPVQ